MSFTVRRVADVDTWAKWGEENLFDLRTGPFKGIGSLARVANEVLRPAWTTGDSAAVSTAMTGFREKYQESLLDKAPFARPDQANYRPWARRVAQWLYSTKHITIEYGISYDSGDDRDALTSVATDVARQGIAKPSASRQIPKQQASVKMLAHLAELPESRHRGPLPGID